MSYVFAETDSDGNLISSYLRGYGLVNEKLYSTNETFYYALDGNADVRILIDDEGIVTDTYRFDAFGNSLIKEGNTRNPYGYRSEEADSLTGLVYLRARFMNPSTGTFISEDSFGGFLSNPITLNRYAYAGQNPVSFADPSGHYTSLGMALATMSVDNLVNQMRQTMSSGMLGALNGELEAISNGDTDLTTAIFKGYSMGLAGATLGTLKAWGQAVNSAKLLYVVGALLMSYYDICCGLEAMSEGHFALGSILIGLGVFGIYDATNELSKYCYIVDNSDEYVDNIASRINRTKNKKQVGSYVIEFESGKCYVGKGTQERMEESARYRSKVNTDKVVSKTWEPAASNDDAFIDEYLKLLDRGGPKSGNNYNVIESPGKRILEKRMNQ